MTAAVDPSTLTLLKVAFLVLLYLFLFRAVRAVYLELSPRRLPAADQGARAPAPAPPPPRRAAEPRRGGPRVEVVAPPDVAGAVYALDGEISIGRDPGCTIRLDDSFASQSHARLVPRDGGWQVEDLGSTNGTYVNSQRISRVTPVRKGDRVQIGQTVLELKG